MTVLLFGPADAQQGSGEYQVKAAYLYDFAKTTHWPEHALPLRSNLVLCVLGGDEEFPKVLRETLYGKSINGHALEIRRSRSTEELKFCNMVFLRESTPNLVATISSLGSNSLLIGEGKEFLASGGMISLEFANGKVTYELNPAALERSNLRYEDAGSAQGGSGDPISAIQFESTRAIKSRDKVTCCSGIPWHCSENENPRHRAGSRSRQTRRNCKRRSCDWRSSRAG